MAAISNQTNPYEYNYSFKSPQELPLAPYQFSDEIEGLKISNIDRTESDRIMESSEFELGSVILRTSSLSQAVLFWANTRPEKFKCWKLFIAAVKIPPYEWVNSKGVKCKCVAKHIVVVQGQKSTDQNAEYFFARPTSEAASNFFENSTESDLSDMVYKEPLFQSSYKDSAEFRKIFLEYLKTQGAAI